MNREDRERLLLTEKEIKALHPMNYVTCLPCSQKTCQAQLDKILNPEWKDKPDSEGFWVIEGKFVFCGYGKYLILIHGLHFYFLASNYKSVWLPPSPDANNSYYLKDFEGKWSKAIIPE